MKKRTIITSLLVLGVAGACADALPEQGAEVQSMLISGAGEAKATLANSWNGGYCVNVDVSNRGTTPITDWTLTLAVSASSVTSVWGATSSASNNSTVMRPQSWNQTIGVGAKATLGLCANGAVPDLQALPSKLDVVGGGGGGAGGSSGTGGATARGGSGGTSSVTTPVQCSGTPLTGGTTRARDGSGTVAGGYSWDLWHSGPGTVAMNVYGVGAAFKTTWNNAGDVLARVGLKWDETKTYDQYGTIQADFAYTKAGSAGGYSFIGIYGWSNNPLVEYFIIEDWYGTAPTIPFGTQRGTRDIDGSSYKLYSRDQIMKPTPHGTASFKQFFSVRQRPRQCGHISISEHFRQWSSLGMTLGKMSDAKFAVEVGGGAGNIDFTAATITAN